MVTRRSIVKLAGVAGTVPLAGCSGLTGSGEENPPACETVPAEPNYGEWFDGVGTYRGTCDARGEDEVRVLVGAHGGLGFNRFAPAAVAVSPDTTVVWEWTGKGGAHNVVAESGTFDSGDPVDSGEETFEFSVATPGLYKYYCRPHRGMGMRGAVYTTTG